MPPSNARSLEVVKRNVGLAYGDVALMGRQLIECLEYELGQRDARTDALEARIVALEES